MINNLVDDDDDSNLIKKKKHIEDPKESKPDPVIPDK